MLSLLNLLIDIESALHCGRADGFIFSPLPCRRILWEAPSADSWRAEYRSSGGWSGGDLLGLTTSGELLPMRFGLAGFYGAKDGEPYNWEKWFAEQDLFGPLIMMASALL